MHTLKKLTANLFNSLAGLKSGFSEHSFVVEIVAGIILLPLIYFVNKPLTLKFIMVLAYFLLLATELLNTCVEKICDKITKEHDEDIKNIKDMASAAVFMVLIANLVLFGVFLAL